MNPAAPKLTVEAARTLLRPDGVRIAYRVTRAPGDVLGPPVVLIHGLASNLTRWSEFVELTTLAERHAVIRLDLRGHGDSPTRGAIGIEQWAKDLIALLDQEGESRAALVGHSLGAHVALECAYRHSQRVHGIALIDPVFRRALRGRAGSFGLLRPLVNGIARLIRGLNALGLRRRQLAPLDLRAMDRLARIALASPDPAAEAEFVRQYSSTAADLRSFRTAHYVQELAELFRPSPPPSAVAVPVLALLSTGSSFTDPALTAGIVGEFPRGEVQMIDCHHWPLTERPTEVREAVEAWCATLKD